MRENVIIFVSALAVMLASGFLIMLFGDNRCIDPCKNPGWCGDLSNDVVFVEVAPKPCPDDPEKGMCITPEEIREAGWRDKR